jgi:hypothetical protein
MAATIRQLTYFSRLRATYDCGPAGPGRHGSGSAPALRRVNTALAARMKPSSTTGSRSAARSSRRSSSSVHADGFMTVTFAPEIRWHARGRGSNIQEHRRRPAVARHQLVRSLQPLQRREFLLKGIALKCLTKWHRNHRP